MIDDKSLVKIYFRIFPLEKSNWEYLKILDDQKTIYIRCLQELSKGKEYVIPTFWTFRTDGVFVNSRQEEIYQAVVPEIKQNLFQKRDIVIMAFGQTRSGKSLTISGLHKSFEDRGILPRIVEDLFPALNTKNSKLKCCVQISYVEFSNNNINDLLKPFPNHIHNIKDVIKAKVKSVDEVLKMIFTAEGRKLFSEKLNYNSNSCTSIFTFYINTKLEHMQETVIETQKLHIIDFAGVDTIGNLSCFDKEIREVGTANLAKTQFEQFFLILCSDIPDQVRVKQRLNPIVQYLADSLKKTTILRLLGHIRPTKEDIFVTISLLRFGDMIGGLALKKRDFNMGKEFKKESNLELKSIPMQDLGNSLSQDRMAHIERTVNEFLDSKINKDALLNVCDVGVVLDVLRKICQKTEPELVVKENVKTRKASVSSSNKVQQKWSQTNSNKTNEKLPQKLIEEKVTERSVSGSLNSRRNSNEKNASKDSSMRPKTTSNGSLGKRPSTSRRKSSSSASIRDKIIPKSSQENVIVPTILPAQKEAWASYLEENSNEYKNIVELYEKNNIEAKHVYGLYLSEVENLRQTDALLEKHNTDLLMAKMTRELHYAKRFESDMFNFTNFEKCCYREMKRIREKKKELRETVLRYQAELNSLISYCNELKRNLEDCYSTYCRVKFGAPVINVDSENIPDILECLEQEQEIGNEIPKSITESEKFESFKRLIQIEQKKKRLYLKKHREWIC